MNYYQEMLPLDDINKINYYINICISNNFGKRDLRKKIKLKNKTNKSR